MDKNWAVYHINMLPPRLRDYGFAYWTHLNSGGPQPNHGDFGLSDAEAEQVRSGWRR
jgi:hypothetical protein